MKNIMWNEYQIQIGLTKFFLTELLFQKNCHYKQNSNANNINIVFSDSAVIAISYSYF